ncbi:MAG: isochorismatase family cysteine hydrolase [Cyanobacteriota bacterium]
MEIYKSKDLVDTVKAYLDEKMTMVLKAWERNEHVFDFDIDKAALIVVDMQNYYCSPSFGVFFEDIENVIANINSISELCRMKNIPVIWLRQNFTVSETQSDDGLYAKLHKKPLNKELCNLHDGTKLYNKLNINKSYDYEITKNRYSAFINNSSTLHDILRNTNRTQLIFTGLATNVCVESTIRDAMQLDYETFLISDATSTVDQILHHVTIVNVKLFFGEVYKTQEIIDLIKR